jgi:hypothetical protein
MTVSDLDRLASKTDMNPMAKTAMRLVRSAVMTGRCGDAVINNGTWSVAIDTEAGRQVRMSFSFKRGQDARV